MKIVVVGTSNSVIGNKGYLVSLGVEHNIVQLSQGRTNFYHHITTILNNREMIEAADVLIIDHYVNDVNFYYEKLEAEYSDICEQFYQLLSALNTHVVNILFPIIDLKTRESFEVYRVVNNLSKQYKINLLDLNTYKLNNSFFRDKIHINTATSYALGIVLSSALNELVSMNDKPNDGVYEEPPFIVKRFQDLVKENPLRFQNSLVDIEYIELEKPVSISLDPSVQLLSIGFIKLQNSFDGMGVEINGIKYGLNGFRVAQEAFVNKHQGRVEIKPLLGTHSNVRNLMDRGAPISGSFGSCLLVNMLFIDRGIEAKINLANRSFNNIKLNKFVEVASKLNNGFEEDRGVSAMSKKSVDLIRDTAVSIENTNVRVAKELMQIAHLARPHGPFIKKKIKEYERILKKGLS